MPGELKFAVLIDADNIAPKYIKIILNEIINNGIIEFHAQIASGPRQ